MARKRLKLNNLAEMAAGAKLGQDEPCMAKAEPNPHWGECRRLREEARRALKRLIAYAAEHDQTYELQLATEALGKFGY